MVNSASPSLETRSRPLAFHPEGHRQFMKQGVPIESECFLEKKRLTQANATHGSLGITESFFQSHWNCPSAISCTVTALPLSSACYTNAGPSAVTHKVGGQARQDTHSPGLCSPCGAAAHGLGDACAPWRGCKHVSRELAGVTFLPGRPDCGAAEALRRAGVGSREGVTDHAKRVVPFLHLTCPVEALSYLTHFPSAGHPVRVRWCCRVQRQRRDRESLVGVCHALSLLK